MKERTVIYSLIAVITLMILGGGVIWFSSQSEPEISTVPIINQVPQVLGEEIEQVDIQEPVNIEPVVKEEIIEEPAPTPQPVVTSGMSSSEVNSLFQTHYKRAATQDEINWWSTKSYSELETSLTNNPIIENIPDTPQQTNSNIYVEPAPTVDPTIKIELCKAEAETAKTNATKICNGDAYKAYEADPGYDLFMTNIKDARDRLEECNNNFDDILNPSSRGTLIIGCKSMEEEIIGSSYTYLNNLLSKYLEDAPACADEVYQSTYTECLNM